jgi:uncharacterized membrane protein
MRLEEYKLILIIVGLIGVLLFATPTLILVVHLPTGEKFSELYVLGSKHKAEDYPYNLTAGENYSVIVGVGNHVASSAYYMVYVKFRNETDLLPNSTTGSHSPVQPLYEYRFIIKDGEIWESPVTFSVSDTSVTTNESLIKTLTINGVAFNVDKPATWNPISNMFYYPLLLELWMYDIRSNSVQYNNRFVDVQLNLTRST